MTSFTKGSVISLMKEVIKVRADIKVEVEEFEIFKAKPESKEFDCRTCGT